MKKQLKAELSALWSKSETSHQIPERKLFFSGWLSLFISLAVFFSLNNPCETQNNKDK